MGITRGRRRKTLLSISTLRSNSSPTHARPSADRSNSAVVVNAHGGEPPEVYLERTSGHPVPRIAVPTTADGNGNPVPARERHAMSHVIDIRGAHHRERTAIVGEIPNPPWPGCNRASPLVVNAH